jgi:hypothetical protein
MRLTNAARSKTFSPSLFLGIQKASTAPHLLSKLAIVPMVLAVHFVPEKYRLVLGGLT